MVVILFLILWLIVSPALASQSCPANTVPVGNGVQIDPTCKKVPDVAINDAYSGVGACSSHQWVDALTRDVAPTCAQPNFTDLAGTIAMSQFASQSANTVLAGPNGSSGTPSFRSLVGPDLPNPSSTTLGGIQSFAAQASKWINSISTSGVPSATQPAFTDISGTASNAQLPAPYGNSTFTAHGHLLGEGGSNIGVTAACATGAVDFGQTGADPICSTLLFANSATAGDLIVATATNQLGSVADVAVNQVLVSGGVGVVPAFTASPRLTALGLGAAAGSLGITESFSVNGSAQAFTAQNTSNGNVGYNIFSLTNDLGHVGEVFVTSSGNGANPDQVEFISTAANGFILGSSANATDYFQTNGLIRFNISGDGGIFTNNATGGSKGNDTFNLHKGVYIDGTSRVNADGTLQPLLTTVGALPTCNAGEKNAHAGVTDADACTFLATVTHTVGALFCPVVCNGANWQGA